MLYNKSEHNSAELTAEYLKKGGICIIPTDTVYGFSGLTDKNDSPIKFECEKKIASIKGRPESKPLIQLIAEPEDIYKYTEEKIPDSIMKFWPGPLTVIVPLKNNHNIDTELKNIAFRCPGDLWLRTVIKLAGNPVFSTSCNLSGEKILENISEIEETFSKKADLIINDGDKRGGIPSTLISLENGQIKILRQGAITI